MQSGATTVDEYLAELPDGRRGEMEQVLALVRAHLPEGLSEEMGFGMITWVVPLTVVPDTYNGKPLMYAALASQSRHISLFLMTLYSGAAMTEEEFRERWAGQRKLNMGRSCVRFATVDDIDTGLIAEVIDGVSVDQFVAHYKASVADGSRRRARK